MVERSLPRPEAPRQRPAVLAWVALGLGLAGVQTVSAQTTGLNPAGGLGGQPGLGGMGMSTPGFTPLGTGAQGAGGRALEFLPGVRSTVFASDTMGTSGKSGYTAEFTPYLSANVANARTQGSIAYQMRNFYSHTNDASDTFVRHDLRSSVNSLVAGDWLGVQASAAIYNTNASIAGGLSADPATSSTNNAQLRTYSLSPYVQGRAGGLATYRVQYRYDQTDTSNNVNAALAKGSHLVSLNLAGGPQFNPWGWAVNASGSRREFTNGVSLSNASTVANLYYTPSAELRLGASMNYLYIERLTNASGETNGWGPGVSVDWTPSRRTTVRGSIARQYYGNSEFLSLAHRTNRLVFGLDYSKSILQSNNAALLTFSPGAVFSAGGFAPGLNPLFTQLADQGLLSRNDVVIGTNVINDALVRNRTLSASMGYVMPRWSATATVFRSTRETALNSEVFGISNALSAGSFGLFNNRGITLASTFTLDARNSIGLSASVRDTEGSSNVAGSTDTKARFSLVQGTFSSLIDNRTTASLGLRRVVQTNENSTIAGRDENVLFGTLDFRLR
jgi:uncharacterized protein (PEP-CTERM system associated)